MAADRSSEKATESVLYDIGIMIPHRLAATVPKMSAASHRMAQKPNGALVLP